VSSVIAAASPDASSRPGIAPPATFTYLSGQYDNLGDALLRRAFAHALGADRRWHVYLGAAPDDYVAALELPRDARTYRSLPRWLAAASVGMLRRGRSRFLANPGEISSSLTEFALGGASAWLLMLGRLVGNPGFRLGVGARDRARPASLGHELAVRLARVNAWRDETSRNLYGRGDVCPDWAFALSPEGAEHERRNLALAYRTDRPLPSDAVLHAVIEWSRERGLEPIAVSQTLRDRAGTALLAQRLGVAHAGTEADDLTTLEREVRGIYQRSALVLGNRIHALIVGAVDGAAPAIVIGHPDVKIARTMRPAGLCLEDGVTADAPDAVGPYLESVYAHADDDRRAVGAAGAALRCWAEAAGKTVA